MDLPENLTIRVNVRLQLTRKEKSSSIWSYQKTNADTDGTAAGPAAPSK